MMGSLCFLRATGVIILLSKTNTFLSGTAPPTEPNPDLIKTLLTSGMVGHHSHGEVDLPWVQVWGRADGVVAGLQQGQLGEQQGGGHLDGRKLLHHLHQSGIVVPLPLLVLLQTLG